MNSGPSLAQLIMERDYAFKERLKSNIILHLYHFEAPCITYGHFIPFKGSGGVKRPTGGGVTYHIADCPFSVGIPKGHPLFSYKSIENYQLIQTVVARVVWEWVGLSCSLALDTCFEKPTNCFQQIVPTDLLIRGKKVAGGAERRFHTGFLHQGTIFLGESERMGNATSLLGVLDEKELSTARAMFKKWLVEIFTKVAVASSKGWPRDYLLKQIQTGSLDHRAD